MNTAILEQYGVSFRSTRTNGRKFLSCGQEEVSNLSYSICGYLNGQPSIEYLQLELLIEIDKAIAGDSFEEDGGGVDTDLEVGYPNSTFTSGGGTNQVVVPIPTEDLKEIILSWIEFLNNN